jgi:PAS domain S-box-containing protein
VNPVLVQTCLAGPLVAALAADALLRPRKSTVHWCLFGLLVAVLAWMGAQTLRFAGEAPPWPAVSFHLLFLSSHALPPLALWLTATNARLAAFERGGRALWLCALPFAALYAGFLTNPWHHLFYAGADLSAFRSPPREWAGPLFVAYQLWTYGAMVAAVAICARDGWDAARARDRRRAWLLAGALVLPLFVQAGFMLGFLPLSFPLTPASLGVSALMLVAAIGRYELFETPPLVRHDVLDLLRDGLVLADGTGSVVDANVAAERILGVPRRELAGRSLESVVGSLGGADRERALAASLAATPFDAEPATVELDDGSGRIIELDGRAVRRAGPHPAVRFVVLRDRTGERRNERALRQRQKLESVGILAAGVAHEVNNPLAFVRANLVHLRGLEGKTPEDRDEIAEVVDESLVGLDRIARIVEGMLHLSRRASDRAETVAVNAAVEEALRFASLHESRRVRVETELAADLPRVRASTDHLVQVLLNLLLNARQALAEHEGGSIVVSTRRGEGCVEIAVTDDGPGVPTEHRERIFTPFFTTRAPNQGTGLGLSIAFDIVREHGGTLELEPPRGRGARFVVRLPATP